MPCASLLQSLHHHPCPHKTKCQRKSLFYNNLTQIGANFRMTDCYWLHFNTVFYLDEIWLYKSMLNEITLTTMTIMTIGHDNAVFAILEGQAQSVSRKSIGLGEVGMWLKGGTVRQNGKNRTEVAIVTGPPPSPSANALGWTRWWRMQRRPVQHKKRSDHSAGWVEKV